MSNNFQNIIKFGGIALLILSALYANKESETKTPEVLQDVLDNFANDVLGVYDTALINTGNISIFQNILKEGEAAYETTQIGELALIDDEMLNVMTTDSLSLYTARNFMKYSVFWLDLRDGLVKLNFYNPEDGQTYSFDVAEPEGLNLELTGNYSMYLDIQDDDLRGFNIQVNQPNTFVPAEAYYVNLEDLRIENYYNFDELNSSIEDEIGAFNVGQLLHGQNGLIYINTSPVTFSDPTTAQFGIILDTKTNQYKFYPGFMFLEIENIEGNEVLLYNLVHSGSSGIQRFSGLRDLTSNRDLWFGEIGDGLFTDIVKVGDLTFLNVNKSSIYLGNVLPIYREGDQLMLEEWSSEGVTITLYEDILTNEVVMTLFNNELVDRYYNEGIRTSFRFVPSFDSDSAKENWDQIYNFMEESLNSIGLELRREKIEIINDELLLEEPR